MQSWAWELDDEPPIRLTFGVRPGESEERIRELAAAFAHQIRWANRQVQYDPAWDWRIDRS